MDNRIKISILWGLFLFGMVFHTLLSLLPLFFGGSVSVPGASGIVPESMNWMSLGFYLIPMILVALITYISAKWLRIVNTIFAALFTIANGMHVAEEIGVNHVQALLLGFTFIVTALITYSSYKWIKEA